MHHNQLPELPSDLKSLAADLAALAPAAGDLLRDELMYRAGWEACVAAASGARSPVCTAPSGRGQRFAWLWPLCTAGLLLLSATLGIALATRTPEIQVDYVERPGRSSAEAQELKQPTVVSADSSRDDTAAVSSELPTLFALNRTQVRSGHEYLSLRQRVLAFGVDVLHSRAVAPSSDDDPTFSDSRYGALIGQLRGG